MGFVNFVITSVGKCLDAVCFLLDLNFLMVHTVVRTLLAVLAFIHSVPSLLISSALQLGNLFMYCGMCVAEASSNLAHGSVTLLGSVVLALEGLLESLKMVGYLSMHVLLRGKEHLCRSLLSLLEGCGIALSLVVYFTNTVVNFALIATHNVYLAVVSVWQTVSSPLQKVVELALTSITFLSSCLTGTSAFLWSPCKLVLDFLISLLHMFVSIFILNIYGLLLTITIALTTTAYLNPGLAHQAFIRAVDYMKSFRPLRGFYLAVHRRVTTLWNTRHLLQHLCQLLRTMLHRGYRVQGDGGPGERRRDPPDGRAGDGDHRELLDLVFPSSSKDPPLKKKLLSSSKKNKHLPAESLLTLLKEQEERKKCVICQDCTKTVVLLPCRHLCLCRDCTNILLRQPIYQQNCPLCRHMILNTMDVYL
uniref:E3 ubiquitin-protein ligase RNF26 n=1 Tax=Oryzias melastigma TaxID=30732 RepID=A0A3B3C914_ORYME